MSDSVIDCTIIAIDGPSASGKSTVARAVAEKLGCVYVDSGSLYRGLTWKVLEEGIDLDNMDGILISMQAAHWEFEVINGAMQYMIDGHTPVAELRELRVHESVSKIACIPEVRKFVNDKIRSMAEFGCLAVEGRDIGTVVFPETEHKFYLDADPAERARRRNEEFKKTDTPITDVKEVEDSLKRRDEMDSKRKADPLQIALGAKVINSTGMSIDDVVITVIDSVGTPKKRDA